MVALWSNINMDIDQINLNAIDICDNEYAAFGELAVKRLNCTFSEKYYDKRKLLPEEQKGILCGIDGLEKSHGRAKPAYSNNILGYMVANGANFDNPDLNTTLLVGVQYNGNGICVRKDNYLEKLPMFAAGRYITYNRTWTERARIMKSADGHKEYSRDVQNGRLLPFLRKCLLFTCFEMQNHMREFIGSDGRFYRNQLTLDTTNGKTLAATEIDMMQKNKAELELIEQWQRILHDAKQTEEYNPSVNYGLYQIYKELDIDIVDQTTGEKYAKYDSLRGNLRTMKALIKQYYNSEIVPTLFEYQFLK